MLPQKDNGKNFNTYQTYLELYDHMKHIFEDECNEDLSDFCFTYFCNLSKWFYQNCQPEDTIPMTLKQNIEWILFPAFLFYETEDEEIEESFRILINAADSFIEPI